MNNILVTTSSFADHSPELPVRMNSMGLNVVLNPYGRKLSEGEVTELIEEHRPVGMIAGVEPLTRKVLGRSYGLKVISRCGIGLDSVDLEAAKEFGISVTNTPDAPTVPVAELTIGMILGLLRQIHVSHESIYKGGWERPMGGLLFGKTVGIVGCGRIGSRVAKMLAAFDCSVLGADEICPSCSDIKLVELEELLPVSDIISLHLPYCANTHHFINTERLSMMKKGAYLVNAARGGLIDERALHHALGSGHLAGAAIDCFEQEPYKGPLTEMNNVLLTAHIGSYAREGRTMMESQAVDNLLSKLEKKELVQ